MQDMIQPSRRAVTWPMALIGALAILLVTVETSARLLVRRVSRIERRIGQEYTLAIAPQRSGRPVALFVGNSLLDASVNFDRLKNAVAADVEARRLMIEQTAYYDWRYGLRRLFTDGARPKVVVLMLHGNQLVSNGSRGEYSAHTLVRLADVIPMSLEMGLHPTNIANMVAGHISMFYGLRSEIRKVVLGRLMPDLPLLTTQLTMEPAPEIPHEILRERVQERSAILKEECARYDTQLILALPPLLDIDDAAVVKFAAESAGLRVIMPYRVGDYTPAHFFDGFHVNAAGAAKYSESLLQVIKTEWPLWVGPPRT